MQFLGKYSSEIIALCALFFTAWQAFIQRGHNKISVKPLLLTHTARSMNAGFDQLQFTLTNSGLGPASIEEFEISRDGKVCDIEDVIRDVLGPLARNSSHTRLREGYAMPQNTKVTLLSVDIPKSAGKDVDSIEETLESFDMKIRYSSAYGETFCLDTAKGRLGDSA